MKTILTNAFLGMGILFLFFIVYSLFVDDTVIMFKNGSNYSMLLLFLAFICSRMVVDYIRNKISGRNSA